jgi:hypothetical protein
MKKQIEVIPPDVIDTLASHAWPGNIRELENYIERAVILTQGPVHPAAPASQNYGQVPGYTASPESPAAAPPMALPPGLHWAILLVLTVITFGVFAWVWMFVEASYVRKIRPQSKALVCYAIALAGLLIGSFIAGILQGTLPDGSKILGGLSQLGFFVLLQVGHFSLKSSLEEYYTRVENIHLNLSGGMTFFFNTVYFQYHLSQIRRWKLTAKLT